MVSSPFFNMMTAEDWDADPSTDEGKKDADAWIDKTALFDLVIDADWGGATVYCNKHANEAKTWVQKKGKDKLMVLRRLPIHEACIRAPTESLIEALLEAYPASVTETDHNGRLPIHHACAHGASKEVVMKLVMAHPDSLNTKDVFQKTPANVSKGSSAANRDEIVDIVDKRPEFWHSKIRDNRWIAEMKRKQAELDKSRAENLAYAQEVEKLRKEAESEKQAYDNIISKLQSDVDAGESDCKEKVKLVKILADEEKSKLQRSIEALQEKEISLKEHLDNISAKLVDAEAANVQALEKFAETTTTIEHLSEELVTKGQSEKKIRANFIELQSKFDKTSMSLDCKIKSEQTLRNRVSGLTSKLNDAINEISTREEKIERSEAVNAELQAKLAGTTEKIQNLEEELQNKDNCEKSLGTDVVNLTAKHNNAKSTITILEGRLASVESANDVLRQKLLESTKKFDHLNQELQSMTETGQALKAQNFDLMKDLDQTSMSLEDKIKAVESLENTIMQLTTELDDATNTVEVRDREIALAQTEMEETNKTLVSVQDWAKTESEKMKHELQTLGASEKSLTAEVENLTTALTECKASSDATITSYKENRQDLEAEIERLRKKLSKANSMKVAFAKKAKEDNEAIGRLNKASSDFFSQTTYRMEGLERRLAERTEALENAVKTHGEEKERLSGKVTSLENTIVTLIGKRSQEQANTIESFETLERALAADSQQHEQMLQAVMKRKQSLAAPSATGYPIL